MTKISIKELEYNVSKVKNKEVSELTMLFDTGIFTISNDGTWNFSYYDQLMYPKKPKETQ